jgi:hypothetical protein
MYVFGPKWSLFKGTYLSGLVPKWSKYLEQVSAIIIDLLELSFSLFLPRLFYLLEGKEGNWYVVILPTGACARS